MNIRGEEFKKNEIFKQHKAYPVYTQVLGSPKYKNTIKYTTLTKKILEYFCMSLTASTRRALSLSMACS